MKPCLFIPILIILFLSEEIFCQEKIKFDEETGRYFLQQIVEFDSISKDETYLKIKDWFGEHFKNAEEVITSDNRETGKIIGRYIDSYHAQRVLIDFYNTIKIDIKEGRYRVTVTNITGVKYDAPLGMYLHKNNQGEFRDFSKKTLMDVENKVKNSSFLASKILYIN